MKARSGLVNNETFLGNVSSCRAQYYRGTLLRLPATFSVSVVHCAVLSFYDGRLLTWFKSISKPIFSEVLVK